MGAANDIFDYLVSASQIYTIDSDKKSKKTSKKKEIKK